MLVYGILGILAYPIHDAHPLMKLVFTIFFPFHLILLQFVYAVIKEAKDTKDSFLNNATFWYGTPVVFVVVVVGGSNPPLLVGSMLFIGLYRWICGYAERQQNKPVKQPKPKKVRQPKPKPVKTRQQKLKEQHTAILKAIAMDSSLSPIEKKLATAEAHRDYQERLKR